MLTQRTNILFDEETLRLLKSIAKEEKTSVGKLVRQAVKKEYAKKDPYAARRKALEETLRIRPAVSKTPIDYKELINYGRKY